LDRDEQPKRDAKRDDGNEAPTTVFHQGAS
jgi:hypothetical protein